MERKKKQQVMEEMGARLKGVNALFLTEYSGMSVAQTTRLRRELGNAGAEFEVVKNTLFKIISTSTDVETIHDAFTGPNAVVYSYKDPAGVAKALAALSKEMPKFKIKVGLLGKQRLSPEQIVKLASLPSKEMLISKLLGLMQMMPQRLVNVLQGNLTQLVLVLSAIKGKKEETVKEGV